MRASSVVFLLLLYLVINFFYATPLCRFYRTTVTRDMYRRPYKPSAPLNSYFGVSINILSCIQYAGTHEHRDTQDTVHNATFERVETISRKAGSQGASKSTSRDTNS